MTKSEIWNNGATYIEWLIEIGDIVSFRDLSDNEKVRFQRYESEIIDAYKSNKIDQGMYEICIKLFYYIKKQGDNT